MTQLERLEFKAAFTADTAGLISGKAWDFNSPDRVGDDIRPEAFTGAIGKTMPMLFAHDHAQTIGVWDSVSVAADGLQISGKLLVGKVARADEVRALIEAKAITGLSIGFTTTKSAPRQGGGRTITSINLLECSLVAIPAHPQARIATIKELNMPELKTIEAIELELKAANDNIELVTKRLDEAETKLARPAVITKKDGEPTAEQKAFANYLRLGNLLSSDEAKTLTVGIDTQGGYLAPAELSTEFIRNLIQFSPVRSVASVRSTANPAVIYPKRLTVTAAKWKGEIAANSASEPTFGQAEIAVKTLTTYVDISNELLADSAGAAEAEVRFALADDFGRTEAAAFLTGDGVNQPKGILATAGIAETVSGGATTVTADALINLMYALPAAYRSVGSWAMNGTTLGQIMKLKDGQGNYLWQPSYQAGAPSMILGRPVVEMVDMPDVAANAYPIIFGDWSQYRILDRVGMTILSDPYSQATNTITRLHASRRVGGDVLKTEAFRKLKIST